MSARELITEHLDLWTGAVTKKFSSGRGSNGKVELTGIKKLRELILELAVRGKLLEQDPTDEPADELLLKVYKENNAYSSKTKKTSERTIDYAPTPYLAPHSWAWARLGDLFDIVYGKGLPKSKLTDEGYAVFGANGVIGKYTEYSYEHPQLLISCRGAYSGKANISPAQCFITSNTLILRNNWSHLSLQYFYYALAVADKSKIVTGSAQPQVTTANLSPFLVAVPPLQEQHRIVQKVDELMALCDRLEQQTSDQLEAHETLVDTLLATLTQSENATELADNWARLAAHFDTLFTTEQSIDMLKQTILQLAVMGRLVEQDAGNESAENMIAELAEVKQELVAKGLLKKERRSQSADSDEVPYEIPQNWCWCSLTDIGELARGKSKHRPRNDPSLYQNGTTPLVQTGDVARASPWITTFSTKYNQKGVEQSRVWKPGTLCITIAANIGDTGLLCFDACFPDSVVGFTPFRSDIRPEYFEYFLRTAKQHLEDFAPSTAQKNINLDVLQKLLVPLPPVAEMKRIVERTDELMALCDQLKECLNQARNSRCQLAETTVQSALG